MPIIRQEIFMALNFRGLTKSSLIHNFCGTNVCNLGINSHTICMETVKSSIFVERAPAKSMKNCISQKFLALQYVTNIECLLL